MKSPLHTLEEAMQLVEDFCRRQNLEAAYCGRIKLVCEELVVNLLKYGGASAFFMNLERKGTESLIRIEYQGPAFDPRRHKPREKKDLKDMEPGGLGLFLVHSLARGLNYNYNSKNQSNELEVTI
jgi:anti-sigma regulatory factor (Ser/Thr protein kinase)